MVYIIPQGVVEFDSLRHRVKNLSLDILKGDMVDHVDQYPHGQRDIARAGLRYAGVTFEMEASGSGVAGTPPDDKLLYLAAAMKYTNAPATSDEYATDGANMVSDLTRIDIDVFLGDGEKHSITDGVNNPTWILEPGKPMIVKHDIVGLWNDSVTGVSVASFGTGSRPVVCMNMALQIGSWTPVIRRAEIALNCENNGPKGDLNATHGVAAPDKTNDRPQLKLTVESPVKATKDWDTEWGAETKAAFVATLGGTAGNIIGLSGDCYQAAYPVRGNDGDVLVTELLFDYSEIVADAGFAVLYT